MYARCVGIDVHKKTVVVTVTLTAAPSAGLPDNANLICPYTTLADGAVVYAAGPINSTGPGPNDLYTWKPGARAWTKIGSVRTAGIVAAMAAPVAAGARQRTLIVIDYAGNVATLKVTVG